MQNVSLRQTPRREISERKKEKHIWEPQPTVKWNGKAFHMKRPPIARSRDYFENNNRAKYFELCVGKVTIVGLTWLANETVSVAFGICSSKFYSSIWISKKKYYRLKKSNSRQNCFTHDDDKARFIDGLKVKRVLEVFWSSGCVRPTDEKTDFVLLAVEWPYEKGIFCLLIPQGRRAWVGCLHFSFLAVVDM